MNITISGSGFIQQGEYERISISGSGRLQGLVRCESFSSSGSSGGEDIECSKNFKISGSSSFSGNVSAENIDISGSFSCAGDIITSGKCSFSGSAKCNNNTKCKELMVSGAFKSGGNVEAEKIKVDGIINCADLIKADEIEIKFDKEMDIGSISGGQIIIIKEIKRRLGEKLPLFSSIVKKIDGSVSVEGSIEGDEIALEAVACPRVTGRIVAVGDECEIGLVQYQDEVEISKNATVGKVEKIFPLSDQKYS